MTSTATATSTEPHLLHAAVHDRIRDLLHDRNWYRTQRSPARWRDLLDETNVELHALIRLARAARRMAEEKAAADAVWRTVMLTRPEQGDPITAAKSYHDWQAAAPDVDKVWSEAEMAYAAGR